MIRLDLSWWCRVEAALTQLEAVSDGEPFATFFQRSSQAVMMALAQYHDSAIIRLSVSEGPATAVFNAYKAIVGDDFTKPTRTAPITLMEKIQLQNAISQFRPALTAELGRIDVYFVKQKGIHSTRDLIERAERGVPDPHGLLSDAAKADIQAGGRCLAFELPTASAFHMMRATETVMKTLMATAGCSAKDPNWGNYIKAMEDVSVDKKITHHLRQIKDLHRNPISHPDVTLDMGEAQVLWSICISAISAMLGEIKAGHTRAVPTTATPAP